MSAGWQSSSARYTAVLHLADTCRQGEPACNQSASPPSTNVVERRVLCLNDYRYGHSCYGLQIGNRTQAFEWYDFQ